MCETDVMRSCAKLSFSVNVRKIAREKYIDICGIIEKVVRCPVAHVGYCLDTPILTTSSSRVK
jgi:hypothetical protein